MGTTLEERAEWLLGIGPEPERICVWNPPPQGTAELSRQLDAALIRRVVMLGAESSGKTTLTRALARAAQTEHVLAVLHGASALGPWLRALGLDGRGQISTEGQK